MKKTMIMIAMLAVAVFSGSAYARQYSLGHSTISDCPWEVREIANCHGYKPPSAPAPAPVVVAPSEEFVPFTYVEKYIDLQAEFQNYLLTARDNNGQEKLHEILKLDIQIKTYIDKAKDASSLLMLNAKLLGIQSQYLRKMDYMTTQNKNLANMVQPDSLLRAIEKRMIQLKLSARDTSK